MGKELGKRISKLLIQHNIQQKEMAERIGITESQLSRYISGDREPKPEILANMATALRTTSDFLLGIENTEFNLYGIKRIIARNAHSMTNEEKKELIGALFGEES